VKTGATQQFTAAVSGTHDPIVIWSLSGAGCAGITCGSINGGGVYTAPQTAPTPPTVTVTATSLADTTASGSATVQLQAPVPVAVSVTPGVTTVTPGSQQVFSASVTGTTNTGVYWVATGAGCIASNCGTVDSTGIYTAPTAIPNPATVSITATSKADITKKASAQVTVAPSVGVSVVPASVQLLIGNQQQFAAQVVGTSNSVVNWSVSGPGCNGAGCGTVDNNGLYTAPATAPSPANVVVAATSAADASKTGGASVTVVSSVTVIVTPTSAHVNPNSQQTFSASVVGTSNQGVTWTLSGAGCSGSACGTISNGGVYTAPATIPNPNLVAVKATSVVDNTKSGTATVYVGTGSPVKVTTSPASANVPVSQTQQFTATVTGATNTSVIWSVAGLGCGGPACGTVDSTGLYTAPAIAPSPASVTVTATSKADSTRSASSSVAIQSNVKVTLSPTTSQLSPGQHTQFTATVTGSNNKNVTWSMSSSNCSGSACGSLTSTGLYTAPPSISQTLNITIKVVPQADTSKSATASVTVALPVVVTVQPKTAQVVVNGQQQFVASASGTSAPLQFNWSVSCTGSCGSIDSTGLYTAPATVPSAAITVTATSQSNSANFGTATVTVIASNNIKLSGQYAFLFHGTDSSGLFQSAGSFLADGKGNVTGGIEDINRTTGPVSDLAFTGKYTIGADDRGVLNLTSSQGTRSYAFTVAESGTLARFIETDASGIRGAGVMKLQNPKYFNNGALQGGYTVSLLGVGPRGERLGALADLFPTGGGFIAGNSMDINDGGNTQPTFSRFSGAYNVANNGRGTLSFTLSGFEGGSFHFTIYVISAGEFFLLSTDTLSFEAPLWNGDAQLQAGAPFTNDNFNGDSIFYQTGWNGSTPDVWVGRLNYDGNGNAAMQFDQNSGGTVTQGNLMTGSYSTAPNGRTSLSLTNLSTRQPYPAIMYAISQNTAFILDESPFVNMGYLEGQSVVAPYSNSDMVGTFTFATTSATGATTPFVSGSANFDGNGHLVGNQDSDLSSGKKMNQLVTGSYAISPATNNGRGVIMLNLPTKDTISVWLATYQRAYGLPMGASDTEPDVLVFEQ